MNEEKFTQELLQEYPAMGTWARRYVSVPSDIEDLVQETVLKAYKYKSQYDEAKGTVQSWLSRIMKHCFIDQYRRAEVRPLQISIEEPEAFTFASEIATEPEQIAYCERMEWSRAIARQPALRGEALRLSLLGNTDTEIAEMLKIPHGTAKSWILRTRKKILKELAST